MKIFSIHLCNCIANIYMKAPPLHKHLFIYSIFLAIL